MEQMDIMTFFILLLLALRLEKCGSFDQKDSEGPKKSNAIEWVMFYVSIFIITYPFES